MDFGGHWRKSLRNAIHDNLPIQQMHKRLEICGGIASGKTTLAQALQREGWGIVLEEFEENPFWQAFYRDPRGTAFETEIKEAGSRCNAILGCDHSLVLDRAYAFTTLADDELKAFLSVFEVLAPRLPPPRLIIHLRCDPAEELRRIVERGRGVEQTATLDFLARLNAAIEEQLAAPDLDVPILPIDSDRRDFREGGPHRADDPALFGARRCWNPNRCDVALVDLPNAGGGGRMFSHKFAYNR
jgi:deoxyguanosine kinase